MPNTTGTCKIKTFVLNRKHYISKYYNQQLKNVYVIFNVRTVLPPYRLTYIIDALYMSVSGIFQMKQRKYCIVYSYISMCLINKNI